MSDGPEFAQRYQAMLLEFIRSRAESSLVRAYELGRQAIAAGMGVLEVAAVHHEAMQVAVGAAPSTLPIGQLLAACECCFAELLSPFEITLRASREANQALQHFNDLLENEIKHLAHSLHGETGQLLAAIQIALGQMKHAKVTEVPAELQRVESLVQHAANQLRQLVHEMQPTVLHDLGLLPALNFLRYGIASRTGLAVSVEGAGDERYPQAMETAMYRVAQEALNNAVKHAAASKVDIRVEHGAGQLVCTIEDDGVGFAAPAATTPGAERGFGLIGMRERLTHLGGSLQIDSRPGLGTRVVARIPIAQ